MDTDIQDAETTLNSLFDRNNRLTQMNAQYHKFYTSIQSQISGVIDDTVKLALQYALRIDEEETFTDL